MNKINLKLIIYPVLIGVLLVGCKAPAIAVMADKKAVPESYNVNKYTVNSSIIKWKIFFKDPNLSKLIDIALQNNQELQITLQDIEIAKNDIKFRKGKLLPMITAGAAAGIEKVGTFTSQGAGDSSADITPGERVPEDLQDYRLGLNATWEVDIWKKLRNSKKAAINRYLSTIEGKNFVLTNLVAEVANNYYELLALDNQLEIIKQNIDLQSSALEIVKIQKGLIDK